MTEVSFLEAKVGAIGTFFILVAIAVGYLIYLSDETIRIIRKILSPVDYIKSARNKQQDENTETEVDDVDVETEGIASASNYSGLSPEETATTIEFNDVSLADNTSSTPNNDDPLDIEIVLSNNEEDNSEHGDETTGNNNDDKTMVVHKGVEEEEAHLDESRQLEPYDPKLDLENYKYPTIDLLKHYDIDTSIDMEEQQQNKNRIIQSAHWM